ncbi:MAG: radical SAM protein [Candidatus Diapherotrites archaeon]|nr:radical SAM protein [Candidatus Diapherotrites archaeon]
MPEDNIGKNKMEQHVYTLPCKPGSVYVNFGAACLNDCRFCVKRFGKFFGYELGKEYSEKPILDGLESIKNKCANISEVVICGIGEPFLHYRELIKIAKHCKRLFGKNVPVRADTSGLWWKSNKNLSFLESIDSLSISLNAESEEKYLKICQPRIPGAFNTLMGFLQALSEEREKRKHFPEIRLTVVDTSRKDLMPLRRIGDISGDCPVPDIQKCREIAARFGFPLIVKHLFMDSHDCWDAEQIESQTLSGKYLEKCVECKIRHV